MKEVSKSRKVLFLLDKKAGQKDLIEQLENSGWQPYIAQTPSQASDLIAQYPIQVGLVLCGRDSEKVRNELVELTSLNNWMEWIVLLNADHLESTDFTSFIYKLSYDYHTLPVDIHRLQITLGHAYGIANLAKVNSEYWNQRVQKCGMIGESPVMLHLFQNIEKISHADDSVLITGETGTGKELIARVIHANSLRSEKPFIVVNCAAIPEGLIESELFGYEEGAFTGAHQRKIGVIEAVHGGTIFLDEIGDLPLNLQVDLLRFLQSKTITRIGGTEEIKVDARVIAASYLDFEKLIKNNQFREDLYFRLNVLNIKAPALREREKDIILLAKFALDSLVREKKTKACKFSQDAIQLLMNYSWPGNVRELINCVRRSAIMAENPVITASDFKLEEVADSRPRKLSEVKAEAEKKAIRESLTNTSNITNSAKQLGVSRITLYRLMDKYSIKASSERRTQH